MCGMSEDYPIFMSNNFDCLNLVMIDEEDYPSVELILLSTLYVDFLHLPLSNFDHILSFHIFIWSIL